MNVSKDLKFVKKRVTGDASRRVNPAQMKELKKEELQLLSKNNDEGEAIRYVTTVDGKEIDYSQPETRNEDDFYLFGDLNFLRRSNEIKELMKKDHSEVFGIVLQGNEIRYCDVDRYDKKFDLIQLNPKKYYNPYEKEDYVSNHNSEMVNAQSVISDHFQKEYDLGYECYDDYLDYRYSFSVYSFVERDRNLTPLVCGIDGCIYECGDEEQLKEHRELHDKELPFPCLNPKCKHQCNSRNELKNHMLQHCKTLFPCPIKGCRHVDTVPYCDNLHYKSHENAKDATSILKKSRSLCNICHKLVRNYRCHKKVHPEFCFKCLYPGCGKVYTQMHKFQSHRITHYLRDLNKKQKLCVCL